MTEHNQKRRDDLLRDAAPHVHRQQFAGSHEQDRADAVEWLARYKDTMTQFKVWDLLNAEEEEAVTIEACDAEEAALLYAEDDHDGHIDNIYEQSHDIQVRHVRTGDLVTVSVQAEMSLSFHAIETVTKDKKEGDKPEAWPTSE